MRLRIILRLTVNRPYPVLADLRESQEVERLRLAFPFSFPVLFGRPPELNSARLIGMEFQPNKKRGRLGGLPPYCVCSPY
jgi:hypothetical protein